MRPPAVQAIPSDARYRAYIPNSILDSGLVAALGHRPLLFAYYLTRALDDEYWFSTTTKPRTQRLSAKVVSPFLQARLRVSPRMVTRYLRELDDMGWLLCQERWISLSDKTGVDRRYFADACLHALPSAPRGVKTLRRRASRIGQLRSRPRIEPSAAPPEQRARTGYTIVDLGRVPLSPAVDRGAVLVSVALYRFSYLGKRIDAPPGYRRSRVSKELLGAALGATRDTIDRWSRRAEALDLIRVEPQGHRRRHVYLLRERRETPIPYWVQRMASSSGAGHSYDRIRALVQDQPVGPSPTKSFVPDG